jgi:uronate dehydrogenase
VQASKPLLLTGAAGGLDRWLRPRLKERYGALRSSDLIEFGAALPGEEVIIADLGDAAAVDKLVAGVGRIIHFGGISFETTFDCINVANIAGTYNLFDAARRHRAGPIVFASSTHATGFYKCEDRLDGRAGHRPDSLYGVSKTFGENLYKKCFTANKKRRSARPSPAPTMSTNAASHTPLNQLLRCCDRTAAAASYRTDPGIGPGAGHPLMHIQLPGSLLI